ncbi:MAG: FAD-binding oxidoreductase [Patescibacteria group bacterium]
MNSIKNFGKKRLIVIAFLALCVFVGAKRIYEYASSPTQAKDCSFAYPKTDETKPTTLFVEKVQELFSFMQKGGVINDASCLNQTSVYGVVKISSESDVVEALAFAREHDLKVTSAGVHHSMGGQSFVKDGLVLDMRGLNQIHLEKEQRILRVQSGATWQQVQQFLDPEGLSVKAMQSINIFTVGGTLSVNAHGIAHNPGPIASTVRSLRIALSDGQIVTASPTENADLFASVIGGYGLFGVILEADLEVVENEMYDWKTDYIGYKEFPAYYKKNIESNDQVGLTFARLSVAPNSYLTETAVHTFTKATYDAAIPVIKPQEHSWLMRLVINFSKTGGFGRWVRWNLEKYAVPLLRTCSRNQAMSQKEVCLVSRNQQMNDSMGYLKNKLKDADILQEYFIPQDRMEEFVDGLRAIVGKNEANLLNVTIRIVHKDTVTALPYAKEDMFAFVLYFNQKLNEEESQVLQKTTVDLIDLAENLDGTFYLPYQLYYSPEQLHKAYPEIDAFFETKNRLDSIGLFANTFSQKYGK